jgi:hypothetical protein
MKHCLEDDEIERQLKYKIHDMGPCILGCFKEYYTKEQFSQMTGGGRVKPTYTSRR